MKKLLVIFSILFIANCCYADQATQVNEGRYVIYQNPTFRGDQFLLDTKTGKIWQMVKDANNDSVVWQQMFFDCYKEDKTYAGRFINPR